MATRLTQTHTVRLPPKIDLSCDDVASLQLGSCHQLDVEESCVRHHCRRQKDGPMNNIMLHMRL